ncbi:MAG: BrnA antitoxin family protein [Algicola sp.]|nr:BrnA antitoxin family protein [Algicola sp.]
MAIEIPKVIFVSFQHVKQITIRLDEDVIEYFKLLSDKNGIPYQNLINLYLKYCAATHKELQLKWH